MKSLIFSNSLKLNDLQKYKLLNEHKVNGSPAEQKVGRKHLFYEYTIKVKALLG